MLQFMTITCCNYYLPGVFSSFFCTCSSSAFVLLFASSSAVKFSIFFLWSSASCSSFSLLLLFSAKIIF